MTRSSFPEDPDTIGRPGDWSDLPMFSAPLPSGPQTPVPSRAANSLAAYRVWRRSEEGGRVFGWILTRAREALARGDRRIGVKQLAEDCRRELRLNLNNSFTAPLADSLVEVEPGLLPLIERRVRKARA